MSSVGNPAEVKIEPEQHKRSKTTRAQCRLFKGVHFVRVKKRFEELRGSVVIEFRGNTGFSMAHSI